MFPLVTEQLIQKLDQCFPQKASAEMTHRQLDHWIGEQRVIDTIKRWHAEQQSAEEQL